MDGDSLARDRGTGSDGVCEAGNGGGDDDGRVAAGWSGSEGGEIDCC